MYTIKKWEWYKNEKDLFVVSEREKGEKGREQESEMSIVRDDTHS